MICPKCSNETTVFNSRDREEGRIIYRRRRCLTCDFRFTTYEAPDEAITGAAPEAGLIVSLDAARFGPIQRDAQRAAVKRAVQLVRLVSLMSQEDAETLLRVAERFADATEADASARESAA